MEHDPYRIYPQPSPHSTHQPALSERLATVEAHMIAIHHASVEAKSRMNGIDQRVTGIVSELNARVSDMGERLQRERENRQAEAEHMRKNTRQVAEILRDKIEAQKSHVEETKSKVLVWVAVSLGGAIVPALLKLVIK